MCHDQSTTLLQGSSASHILDRNFWPDTGMRPARSSAQSLTGPGAAASALVFQPHRVAFGSLPCGSLPWCPSSAPRWPLIGSFLYFVFPCVLLHGLLWPCLLPSVIRDHTCYDLNPLHELSLVLWSNIWSILEYVSCELEENVPCCCC